MQFQIGDRIGDYEIVSVLGAGGMGRVFKVRNMLSDRVEAMKVLLPDLQGDPSLADRFLREIKVQAGLSHPNIAQLFTALRHNNQLLMLMEFVEGVSIEKMLADAGRLSVEKAIDLCGQVLQALGYAHARGVVHRDIKPANIVVTPEGVVKLMDFGIARMKADKKLTATGLTVGSLYYMSPEQINGQLEPDPRSDIYSLGITMYEMVTGKKPYEGSSEYSVMSGHLQGKPSAPIEIVPNVPPLLNEIILMALAKEPQGRFQSAEAFRTALMNVEGSMRPAGATRKAPVTSPPLSASTVAMPSPAPAPVAAPPPPPAAAPSSSRGLWMALGSLVGVGVVLLALFQLPKYFSAKTQDSPVQQQQQQPVMQTQTPVQQQQSPVVQQPPPQQQAPSEQPATKGPVRGHVPLVEVPVSNPGTKPTEPAPAPAPANTQTAAVPTSTPAAPQQQAPAVDQAALAGQQDRMIKMSARASAVLQKLKRLESSQNSQGLGMRADFKSAQARLEQYMDLAEAALKSGNVAGAKTNMDRADRDIEFLEEKLGI